MSGLTGMGALYRKIKEAQSIRECKLRPETEGNYSLGLLSNFDKPAILSRA